MYERFAAPTRRVLVEAQNEARDLGHHFIATHHLVLGLLVPEPGGNPPVRAFLLAAGMTLDRSRSAVLEAEPRRATAPIIGTIPFSPRSKRVLETAFRESLTRGAPEIYPEHVLLAILREGAGSGAGLLHHHGVTHDMVVRWLSGEPPVMASGPTVTGTARRPQRRMTPGMQRVTTLAEQAAGAEDVPIGTQHVLLGLLGEADSAAARVLAALGVTSDAVEAKLAELGVAGTSDGPPSPPPAHVAKHGESVQVRIDDPELAKLLESAGDDAVGDIVRRALLDHLKPPA